MRTLRELWVTAKLVPELSSCRRAQRGGLRRVGGSDGPHNYVHHIVMGMYLFFISRDNR